MHSLQVKCTFVFFFLAAKNLKNPALHDCANSATKLVLIF